MGAGKSGSILIVDDDRGLSETLADYLDGEGFAVLYAGDVKSARNLLEKKPDLILLDLGLPGENGLDFAAELRAASRIPIIMMSGKGAMIDRVVGLEVGADDYLPKPFELREMLARIRAVLRRAVAATEQGQPAPDAISIGGRAAEFGGTLILLADRRQVINQSGTVIDLTPQEYNLLAALVERPKRIHDRDAIANWMSRRAGDVDDRNIDALVSRVRRKLSSHVDANSLIQTVRGQGYILASEVRWIGKDR